MNPLAVNGIDATTGRYLLESIDFTKVEEWVSRRKEDPSHLAELRQRHTARTEAHLGLKEGLDPKDLAQAGWGIIFASADGAQAATRRRALAPLLDLRKRQAGERYREFSDTDAVNPGESKLKFLSRHQVGPDPADPKRVPYYLLICAGPEAIPYEFQYQLDVQYAVGRIHFDSLEEYERYALAVVTADQGACFRSRRAVFFGVQNPDDEATALSARYLVEPLTASLKEQNPGWRIERQSGAKADKAALAEALADAHGPAFLFTVSHGMWFPNGHPRQRRHQGALLCQDWPGPKEWGSKPIPVEHYFSADDMETEGKPGGLVAFHFACYSGGTPRMDYFSSSQSGERPEVAPESFVAGLPNRLLTHPNGGALAIIGHVERVWGYSFLWSGTQPQVGVFESALTRLFNGYPVGAALEYFNEKYAELSTMLTDLIEERRVGKIQDPVEFAGLCTAHNDARSYVILGDPAVKLVVMSEGQHRESNRSSR